MGCGLSAFCKRSKRGDSPPLDAPIRRNAATPKPNHLPLSESPHDDQPRPLQANIDLPAIDEESPLDGPSQLPVFLTVTKRKTTPSPTSESLRTNGFTPAEDEVSQAERSRENSFFTPTYRDGCQEDDQYDEITEPKVKEEFVLKEELSYQEKPNVFNEEDQLAATKIQASYRGFRTRRALATGAAVAGAVGIGFFPLKKEKNETDETPSTSTLAIVPELPVCESPVVSLKGSSRDSAEPRSVNGYYLLKDGAEASASELNLPESTAYQVSEPDEGQTQDPEELMSVEPGEDTDPLLRDESDDEATDNQCVNLIDFGADEEVATVSSEAAAGKKDDEGEQLEENEIQLAKAARQEEQSQDVINEEDADDIVPETTEDVPHSVPDYEKEISQKSEPADMGVHLSGGLVEAKELVSITFSGVEACKDVADEEKEMTEKAQESQVLESPMRENLQDELEEVQPEEAMGDLEEAFEKTDVSDSGVDLLKDITYPEAVDEKKDDVPEEAEESKTQLMSQEEVSAESVDVGLVDQPTVAIQIVDNVHASQERTELLTAYEKDHQSAEVTDSCESEEAGVPNEEDQVLKGALPYYASHEYSMELYEVNSASTEKSGVEIVTECESATLVNLQSAPSLVPGYDSQFLNAVSTHKSFGGMGETLEETEDIIADESGEGKEANEAITDASDKVQNENDQASVAAVSLSVDEQEGVDDGEIETADGDAESTEQVIQNIKETVDFLGSPTHKHMETENLLLRKIENENDNEVEIIIQKSMDLDDEIASVILSALSDEHSQLSSRAVSKEASFAAVEEIDEDGFQEQGSELQAVNAVGGIFDAPKDVEGMVNELQETGADIQPIITHEDTKGEDAMLETDTNIQLWPGISEKERVETEKSEPPLSTDNSYGEQPKSDEIVDLLPSVYKESTGSSLNDSTVATTTEGVACDRSLTEFEVDAREKVEPQIGRKDSDDQVVASILLEDLRRLSADFNSESPCSELNRSRDDQYIPDTLNFTVEPPTTSIEPQPVSEDVPALSFMHPTDITITADDLDEDDYIWRKLQGNASVDEEDLYCKAATKIQATYRGYCTRRHLRETTPDTQVTELSEDDRHKDVLNDIETSSELIFEGDAENDDVLADLTIEVESMDVRQKAKDMTSVDAASNIAEELTATPIDSVPLHQIVKAEYLSEPSFVGMVTEEVSNKITEELLVTSDGVEPHAEKTEESDLLEPSGETQIEVTGELRDSNQATFEVGISEQQCSLATDDPHTSSVIEEASGTSDRTVETLAMKLENDQAIEEEVGEELARDFVEPVAVACDFVSPSVVVLPNEADSQLIGDHQAEEAAGDELVGDFVEPIVVACDFFSPSVIVPPNELSGLADSQEVETLHSVEDTGLRAEDSIGGQQAEEAASDELAGDIVEPIAVASDFVSPSVIVPQNELSGLAGSQETETLSSFEHRDQKTDDLISEHQVEDAAGDELPRDFVEPIAVGCDFISPSVIVPPNELPDLTYSQETEILRSAEGRDWNPDDLIGGNRADDSSLLILDDSIDAKPVITFEEKENYESAGDEPNTNFADSPVAVSCDFVGPSVILEAADISQPAYSAELEQIPTGDGEDQETCTDESEQLPEEMRLPTSEHASSAIPVAEDEESSKTEEAQQIPPELLHSSIETSDHSIPDKADGDEEAKEAEEKTGEDLESFLAEESHPIAVSCEFVSPTITQEHSNMSNELGFTKVPSVDFEDQKTDLGSSDRGSEESNTSFQTIIPGLEGIKYPSEEHAVCPNDGFDPEVAATKIQAAFRGYMVRKNINENQGGSAEELDDLLTTQQAEELESVTENGGELGSGVVEQPGDVQDNAEDIAATKIQAAFRGYQARKTIGDCAPLTGREEAGENHPEDIIEEPQPSGSESEKTVNIDGPEFAVPSENLDDIEDAAATKIQAVFRGHLVRKNLMETGNIADDLSEMTEVLETLEQKEDNEILLSAQDENNSDDPTLGSSVSRVAEEEEAATKIQAAFRGHQVRKNLLQSEETGQVVSLGLDSVNSDLYKTVTDQDEAACCIETEIEEDNEESNLKQSYIPDETEDAAAIKIQAAFRGYQVRKNISDNQKLESHQTVEAGVEECLDEQLDQDQHQELTEEEALDAKEAVDAEEEEDAEDPKEEALDADDEAEGQIFEDDPDAEAAAVILQSAFRGYRHRKQKLDERQREIRAAVKIQSVFRGYLARKMSPDPQGTSYQYEIPGLQIGSASDDAVSSIILERDIPELTADFLLRTDDRSREGSSSSRTTPELSEEDAARRIQGAYRALRNLRSSREPSPSNELREQSPQELSEEEAAKRIQDKFRALRNRRKKTPNREIDPSVAPQAGLSMPQELAKTAESELTTESAVSTIDTQEVQDSQLTDIVASEEVSGVQEVHSQKSKDVDEEQIPQVNETFLKDKEKEERTVESIFDELMIAEPESMVPDSLEPPFVRRDSGTPIDSLDLVPTHLLNNLGPFAGGGSAAADFEPDSLSAVERIQTDSLDLLKEMVQKQEKILEEESFPVDSLVSDFSESDLRPSEVSDFLRDIDADRFPEGMKHLSANLLPLDGTDEGSSIHSNGLDDFLKVEEMVSGMDADASSNVDLMLVEDAAPVKENIGESAADLIPSELVAGVDDGKDTEAEEKECMSNSEELIAKEVSDIADNIAKVIEEVEFIANSHESPVYKKPDQAEVTKFNESMEEFEIDELDAQSDTDHSSDWSDADRNLEDISEDILNHAATRIQAQYRGYRTRQVLKRQKYLQNHHSQKETARNDSASTAEPTSSRVPELHGFVECDELQSAATKIQAGVRGFLVRRAMRKLREGRRNSGPQGIYACVRRGSRRHSDILLRESSGPPLRRWDASEFTKQLDSMHAVVAATVIQAYYRGYKTRKSLGKISRKVKSLDVPSYVPSNHENLAATKIQAAFRGYKTRKRLNMNTGRSRPHSASSKAAEDDKSNEDDLNREGAATKIQANFRGYRVRRELRKKPGDDDNCS